MYFDAFPLIPYDAEGNHDFRVLTNLCRRTGMLKKLKSTNVLYDTYDVKDGEMPEHIAFKLYEDAELHWIILIVNNIVNIYKDWPMSTQNFNRYVDDKYDNVDAVHHYEIFATSGDTTKKINIGTDNSDYPSATAITNYEYEESLQEEKRKIKLLDPTYVAQAVEEHIALMKESDQ
tara:strand:- start:2672 stop:3199 length:528 start_codon:yes stop_codon:yes gene_type:complete